MQAVRGRDDLVESWKTCGRTDARPRCRGSQPEIAVSVGARTPLWPWPVAIGLDDQPRSTQQKLDGRLAVACSRELAQSLAPSNARANRRSSSLRSVRSDVGDRQPSEAPGDATSSRPSRSRRRSARSQVTGDGIPPSGGSCASDSAANPMPSPSTSSCPLGSDELRRGPRLQESSIQHRRRCARLHPRCLPGRDEPSTVARC